MDFGTLRACHGRATIVLSRPRALSAACPSHCGLVVKLYCLSKRTTFTRTCHDLSRVQPLQIEVSQTFVLLFPALGHYRVPDSAWASTMGLELARLRLLEAVGMGALSPAKHHLLLYRVPPHLQWNHQQANRPICRQASASRTSGTQKQHANRCRAAPASHPPRTRPMRPRSLGSPVLSAVGTVSRAEWVSTLLLEWLHTATRLNNAPAP